MPVLFKVESHPSVHHLVSEVRGQLAAGQDVFDLLRASFPGGSITGAPKRRAMQIIREPQGLDSYLLGTVPELIPEDIKARYPNDKTGQINTLLGTVVFNIDALFQEFAGLLDARSQALEEAS